MNNKPVAWMVNDKIYQDIFEAEHYSKFTNKPMIPLYTAEQLEEARKLGMQQERALWNLSESTQEIMNTHPVKEQSNLVNVVKDHIKDLQECVLILNDSMLVNTANEMKVAIKELKDAIDTHPVKELTDEKEALKSLYDAVIRYENLSPFADTYAVESCEFQLHDAKEKARATLRKAQEK